METSDTGIPHLRRTRNSYQLIVDRKPFLMLTGELPNSSLSDPVYMSEVQPNLKAMNVNIMLGALTWEMIDTEEG